MEQLVNSDWSVNTYLHKLSLKLSFNNGRWKFSIKKGVRKSIITFPKKQNIPKYHGKHLPSWLSLHTWEQEVSNVPEADSQEI